MHMQLPPQTTHGGFYFVLVSRNMSAFSKPSWPCAFIWQVGWSFPLASGFQNSHPTGSSKNFSLLNVFSLFVLVFGIGAPCWHFWEKLACCRVWCACWSLNTLDSCSAALYENKWALVVARFQAALDSRRFHPVFRELFSTGSKSEKLSEYSTELLRFQGWNLNLGGSSYAETSCRVLVTGRVRLLTWFAWRKQMYVSRSI